MVKPIGLAPGQLPGFSLEEPSWGVAGMSAVAMITVPVALAISAEYVEPKTQLGLCAAVAFTGGLVKAFSPTDSAWGGVAASSFGAGVFGVVQASIAIYKEEDKKKAAETAQAAFGGWNKVEETKPEQKPIQQIEQGTTDSDRMIWLKNQLAEIESRVNVNGVNINQGV